MIPGYEKCSCIYDVIPCSKCPPEGPCACHEDSPTTCELGCPEGTVLDEEMCACLVIETECFAPCPRNTRRRGNSCECERKRNAFKRHWKDRSHNKDRKAREDRELRCMPILGSC